MHYYKGNFKRQHVTLLILINKHMSQTPKLAQWLFVSLFFSHKNPFTGYVKTSGVEINQIQQDKRSLYLTFQRILMVAQTLR